MKNTNDNEPYPELTSTEISNIWSAYLKSSMEQRFLEYFFATAEDNELKNVVEKMLNHAQQSINVLKDIFIRSKLTIPLAFTDEDVRVGASKVISDAFIFHFCHDSTLLSLSTYPSALSDCIRNDIRNYFSMRIDFTIKMQNEIIELMIARGIYLKPPLLAIDNKVDFVESATYLNGFFGASRSLNAAEIANLSRIIHRAQFSQMIFVAFNKIASSKEMKTHFSKGRDVIVKVLESLQKITDKENIPISASGDYELFDTEISPFSDKLMLFFVNTCLGIFCYAMLCQAMTSSLRSDLIAEYYGISNDMMKYYGEGLLLAVKEHWLEQPPQIIDRRV